MTAPTITRQPLDVSICNGGGGTFYATGSAAAPTGGPSYQWQVSTDGGGTWNNASNTAPYSNVTTDHLTISGATLTMDGYLYRLVLSTPCSPNAISNSARLSISFLPAIGIQPLDKQVCPGAITTFTVIATGTNLRYQWQVNTGTGYVNIPNSPQYSGINSANLTLPSPTVSMNNNLYRVVVSGDCAPAVTSSGALLKVLNPVSIVSQTITDTGCETSEKKIGVKAVGNALIYQWQKQVSPGVYADLNNVPPYSGANTDSLRITNIPGTLNGAIYRIYITEHVLCNLNFYSNDIPFGVNAAPVTAPAKIVAPFFGTATFSVPPVGTSFQWQESIQNTGFADITDTVRYKGVTTNSLTINTLGFDMSGNQYRCIVNGVCLSPVASKASLLIVDPALSVTKVQSGEMDMKVYPNPLSGTQLNISFSKALTGKTEIRVLNKLGKLVYERTITPGVNNTASIELEALAAGTYLLQVSNEKENFKQVTQFTKQ